jgi:uncharacterized protein YkwD
MYRVLPVAILAFSFAGCSLNTGAISSGFADTPDTTASINSPSSGSFNLGASESAAASRKSSSSEKSGTKVARLDDKAPRGTFEKAPTGALSDRDYSHTHLDLERARTLINAYRKENGLKPLKLDPALTEAAKEHSRDLAKWDRISHYGSDGSNPWDRIRRTGFKAKLAAENVGTGQVDFDEVLRGWKESPGHNKNLLLADAQQMGLALVQDPKTEFKSFWTLVIATRM